MKISYQWIRDFIDLEVDAKTLADALTMSGTEVEEILHETVPREVVCAMIIEVGQHPNADRLSICMVDTGDDVLKVVCGAPNVRVGLVSAFAPIGTDLGPGMLIKKAKIRGEESFGMLLSERELGLTDDHTGIMEIETPAQPGESLDKVLGLEDWVFDVNVTPNRGDCLSIIGIARELSVLFRKDLTPPFFEIPEIEKPVDAVLGVKILDPDACPRYTARVLEGINIRKSPFTMRRRLFQSGVRAISNIVDITNYVMLEYGQPLHAFDYELVGQRSIVVRKARGGEKFVTLDSVERDLLEDDLLICDRDKPIALAGVMGGENSEVADTTSTVILESAFFDPVHIRKTSRNINLSTEASYRFERGIDPEIQVVAANRAAFLMNQLADAGIYKNVIDENYLDYNPITIPLRKNYMSTVLGIDDIEDQDVEDIYTRLGCRVNRCDDGWMISPPLFRHDLTREIDLIEEYVRVYGMDNVEPDLPRFKPGKGSSDVLYLREVRNRMAAMGFSEVVTYSFVSPRWKNWFGDDVLELINPISDEMKTMRRSLLPGLLATVAKNKNQQIRDISLFELGKCFYPGPGKLPEEKELLGIAISGQRRYSHWSEKPEFFDFYDIKGFVQLLLGTIELEPSLHDFLKTGHQADIIYNDEKIGYLGALNQALLEQLDIEDDVFVAEIPVQTLLSQQWKGMQVIPKYPMTYRDLSLVVDENIQYKDIEAAVIANNIKELRKIVPIDRYTGDKLSKGKNGITIRIIYQSYSRTLDDEQINKWQNIILRELEKKLGISLRS